MLGDGDHGITMDIGWTPVRQELDARPDDEVIAQTCERTVHAFLAAVGASSGPRYAGALRGAGTAVADRLNLDGAAIAAWIKGMSDGILARGGAKLGDKTMIDAWLPAAEAAM